VAPRWAVFEARSARGASRWQAAYFVVARRREACQLVPPQHGGARCATTNMRRKGKTVPYGRIGYAWVRNSWYSATN
jgi:hypothetical protein